AARATVGARRFGVTPRAPKTGVAAFTAGDRAIAARRAGVRAARLAAAAAARAARAARVARVARVARAGPADAAGGRGPRGPAEGSARRARGKGTVPGASPEPGADDPDIPRRAGGGGARRRRGDRRLQ